MPRAVKPSAASADAPSDAVAAPATNPYAAGLSNFRRGVSPAQKVVNAGRLGALAVTVAREAVTPPYPWIPDAVTQVSLALRRCLIPMAISVGTFMFSYMIVVFGLLLHDLGAVDRHAGGIFIALIREVCVWVTTMIFAGVAGSAVCADLGSRKVREELDALAVMGVGTTRTIVVPRVVGLTVAAPILGMLALLISQVLSYLISPPLLGYTTGVFVDSVKSNILPLDVYASLIKYVVIGFFVAIVACQKGLSAEGGTKGVGVAVNQTVVLAFLGIWIFNGLFNLTMLTLFPDLSVIHG